MDSRTFPSLHQCPLCLNSFSRQEHLHRHMVSHGSNRPFLCEFCSTSFNRADVLKRHLRSCRRRTQRTVVEVPRSSRRRACDRCVRQKRACDAANRCQACIGRGERCTYLHAQASVDRTSNEDSVATMERPESQSFPCEDDVSKPTWSFGTFASADLVPVQMPTGADWDIYWPPQIAKVPSYLGQVTGRPGWEACATPESIVMDFAFSPSAWQSLLEDQDVHGQHDHPPPQTGYRTGSFNFDFLANFTSTTGFVKSFDCGTLEERKLVVRSCTVTQIDELYSVSGMIHPANTGPAEHNIEDSPASVEDFSHIWGIILPEEEPTSIPRTHYQQQAQVKPLYTENWMDGPSEEHRTGPVASWSDPNFSIDLQSSHRLLSNPLSLMTHEIKSRIKEVITLKPRNSIIELTWSSLLEESCLRFFSPPNLLKYIELYWACWHPNCPIVHKPTFSPVAAHPILVAAMAIVGACASPDAHDSENAPTWFDSVEEMAFSDEDFCDNSGAGSAFPMTFDPSKSRRKVQALQAAYTACLYQNWQSSDRNKRRIRRYRYSTMVAVARDLGLENAQHEASPLRDSYLFEWHDFTVREEFIRSAETYQEPGRARLWALEASPSPRFPLLINIISRTLVYIFLMDTAFVIFNNLPPRMVIKELKMDLVCPESCFQAPTSAECFASITSWISSNPQQRDMSLCTAIETILGEDMDSSTRETFAKLGILNLFALASALHYLIFQLQSSFVYEPRLAPLRHALANWKQVWLLHASSEGSGAGVSTRERAFRGSLQPGDMWKRVGFIRYAPEFWLLAKIMLERLEADCHQEEMTSSCNDSSGTRIGNPALRSTILEKYDETSMGQVNDIITMFQRLDL